MKQGKKRWTCLRTKFWLGIFLVAAVIVLSASVLIGYIDDAIGGPTPNEAMAAQKLVTSAHPVDQPVVALIGLKAKIRIAVIVILLILVTVSLYLNRIILHPVEEVAMVAGLIAKGQLNQLVPVHARDEVGQLGEAINDIAMNFQEILLCMWNLSKQLNSVLANAADALKADPKLLSPHPASSSLLEAARCVAEMQATIEAFRLYGVKTDTEGVFESFDS